MDLKEELDFKNLDDIQVQDNSNRIGEGISPEKPRQTKSYGNTKFATKNDKITTR